MSDANLYDGIDPDDAVAMEEVRFQAALKGAKERDTILKVISLANGLQHEVAGETPGYILHYLRDVQALAIKAMSDLIGGKTMTEEERIAARLLVQPYAHLMGWLKDKMASRDAAKVALDDLDRFLDGQVED